MTASAGTGGTGSGGGNVHCGVGSATIWARASAGRCFLGYTYTFKRWPSDSSSTSRSINLYMNCNKSVTAVYTVGGSCQLSEESVDVGRRRRPHLDGAARNGGG